MQKAFTKIVNTYWEKIAEIQVKMQSNELVIEAVEKKRKLIAAQELASEIARFAQWEEEVKPGQVCTGSTFSSCQTLPKVVREVRRAVAIEDYAPIAQKPVVTTAPIAKAPQTPPTHSHVATIPTVSPASTRQQSVFEGEDLDQTGDDEQLNADAEAEGAERGAETVAGGGAKAAADATASEETEASVSANGEGKNPVGTAVKKTHPQCQHRRKKKNGRRGRR